MMQPNMHNRNRPITMAMTRLSLSSSDTHWSVLLLRSKLKV
jgi:hypothetical protein